MPDVITDCPDELSPREIVTRLHAEIAAQSPEQAALVAEYEALPPRPLKSRGFWVPGEQDPAGAALMRGRRERMDRYVRWRISGLGKKAAAQRTGIAVRTARQYEQDIRAGKLEVPGD